MKNGGMLKKSENRVGCQDISVEFVEMGLLEFRCVELRFAELS